MKKCAPQIRAMNGRTQIGIIEVNSNQFNTVCPYEWKKVFTNHRLTSYLAQNDLEMRATNARINLAQIWSQETCWLSQI